ncbi:MAG TPA: transposase [Saprospiraceae bacterium]|nr:transposase [Saprospiraceae bacterium]
MTFNPNIHQRRSIRLKGYDYTQSGMYFITLCIQDKDCLFGEIRNSEMILNEAGNMINKWWSKIPEKFINIELDVFQIMPNHFHAIIINNNTEGANPCVRPEVPNPGFVNNKKVSLSDIVQWFKTMSTNEYIKGVKIHGWVPFNGKLWQRNYYDHIIRNEKSYDKISDYIINNPYNWEEDRFYNK